jgi:hypothetical protein
MCQSVQKTAGTLSEEESSRKMTFTSSSPIMERDDVDGGIFAGKKCFMQ